MKRREAWGALASAFGARGAAKKTTPQRSASQKVTRSRCANRRHVETQEQIELFRWAEREKHRWTMRVPMPLGPVPYVEVPVFDRLLHSSLVGVNLSKAQRGIAKARGVKPDLPDVNLDWPMGGFVGMRVELKAPLDLVPDAGPTDGQLEQIIVLRAAGFYCVVSYGWEDAAGHITRYMNGHIERITTTP